MHLARRQWLSVVVLRSAKVLLGVFHVLNLVLCRRNSLFRNEGCQEQLLRTLKCALPLPTSARPTSTLKAQFVLFDADCCFQSSGATGHAFGFGTYLSRWFSTLRGLCIWNIYENLTKHNWTGRTAQLIMKRPFIQYPSINKHGKRSNRANVLLLKIDISNGKHSWDEKANARTTGLILRPKPDLTQSAMPNCGGTWLASCKRQTQKQQTLKPQNKRGSKVTSIVYTEHVSRERTSRYDVPCCSTGRENCTQTAAASISTDSGGRMSTQWLKRSEEKLSN